jgi:Asp-tRNA(Asn)/Glu-tRNA(Gln) amidotransferase A subunit family amidase
MPASDPPASGGAGGGPGGWLPGRAGVEAALDRIADREPELAAWVTLADRTALLAAAERARGRLAGLPVGVKDIIDTADLPTGYGSPRWAGHRPAADAEVVRRLRAAGAVVVGKTVTTEFALFDPPRTGNPHDPSRTPGGSSSGSAAAVGAGMVPLALGSQTVGSVIRPASFCGVWGFVPSPGLVPRDGVHPLSPTFDRVGLLAASAQVLALALPTLAAATLPPAQIGTRPPRVALVRATEWSAADTSTRRLVEAAAEQLQARELTLPDEFAGLAEAHRTVLGPEAALALRGEAASGAAPSVVATVREGEAVLGTDYLTALDLIARCRTRLAAAITDFDALLVPAAVGEAPDRRSTGDPVMNRVWTTLGVPLLAVPGLRGPTGLPVGLQLVGRPDRDLDLLAVGARAASTLLDHDRS